MTPIDKGILGLLLPLACFTGACDRDDDTADSDRRIAEPNLEAVTMNDQTFLMENKATQDLPFCGISTINAIYEPKSNTCSAVNVTTVPAEDGTGWTGYIWTLELLASGEKIVFDQSRTSLWIDRADGAKLWCYGYQGLLKNTGIARDVTAIFFSDELATLASDLNQNKVIYIASPESVESCDVFKKKLSR